MDFYYKCEPCDIIFPSEDVCVSHITTFHGVSKVAASPLIRVVCNVCRRNYNQKKSYIGKKKRKKERERERERERETERQRDRETERERDRQTDRGGGVASSVDNKWPCD